ncbi:MAG TPA: 2-phospho-L-lactate transferase [Blastocatellia bacterium]|nr:2-phospho-L-lactate transferase [Blastocatellia bacterium]
MRITALAGGIGASKFLLGLVSVLPPKDITVIANTGDDIELFGLRICPDIDTVTYTLGGVINPATGWGLSGDTFECLQRLKSYYGDAWFNLGDRDLATHIFRTNQLRQGISLSEVTDSIRRFLGVESSILPMTNSYTPTRITTVEGEMHLQEYFVRRRCEPRVLSLCYENIELATPAPGVVTAIVDADLVIVCPSNPFISIGPILSVPGLRDALRETNATIIGITPIVGGKALKGPAADMLRDQGHEVSASAVARIYNDFLDIFVLDTMDAELKGEIEANGTRVITTNTIMGTTEQKAMLARAVIEAAFS